MPKGNVLTLTYKKRKKGRRGLQSSSKIRELKYSEKCNFCLSSKDKEEELGKLIKKNGFTVHYFCLLFASGLCQRGRTDKEGIFGFLSKDIDKELSRGLRLKCDYCKELGATIGCVIKTCRKKFHLKCGKENGSLHQFFDTFKSFCPDHRPKQLDLLSSKGKTKLVCPICMSNITNICDISTMKSNCCKNSWFHRNCMQRYSLSAGLHFFKCPMCNDKNKFQQEMLEFGIYIPDQDASWETEPNAFNELLERHNRCDASSCSCPMGRNHDSKSGRWELILCDYCGSQGSHFGCYGLYPVKKGDKICQECWESCQSEESGKKKKEKKKLSSKSKKPSSTLVTLTEAQKKRREAELQKRCKSDKTMVRLTKSETDAEIDVEEKSDDDNDGYPALRSRASGQPRKRRKLSLNRSRRSSNNTSTGVVSANITLSNDSCKHSVTATMSSSESSSITVASSSSATAFFPNLSQELQDDSEPETYDISSDSSDNYSIQDVTDLPDRKSLTITWRGKKIHISNPNEEDPEKIEDWTVQLQVSDSEDSEDSESSKIFLPRKKLNRSCNVPNDEVLRIDCDSPPILVPVDEDISIKCFSPRQNDSLHAPMLSPKQGYHEMGMSQTLGNKHSRNINRMTRATHTGENNLIPSISASSITHTIQPSTSVNSIISISSSDSDSADTQVTKVKTNKYIRKNHDIANLQFENYGLMDLREIEDLASSIQLLPRNTPQSRVMMEPEVVILD